MYVFAALAQSTYKFGYAVHLCGYLYTFFAEINFQSALAGGLHTYSSRNRVFNVCDFCKRVSFLFIERPYVGKCLAVVINFAGEGYRGEGGKNISRNAQCNSDANSGCIV